MRKPAIAAFAMLLGIAIVGLSTANALATPRASALNAPPGTDPPFQAGFPATLSGSGYVRGSSIALGDLTNDGYDEIVVGDTQGKIQVFKRNGDRLWVHDTGGVSIEGKAAIGDVNQDGWNEIVIGAGSTFTPNAHGGLYVLSHDGSRICSINTGDFNNNNWRDGVYSSPALADIDGNDNGKLEIVFGAWDAYIYLINHDCSLIWKKFIRDTIWSSPAIGDIDRDGALDIVIGSDSHAEPLQEPPMLKGGRLFALDRFGNNLPGFPRNTDEVIFSSPALADLDSDGWLEIVAGSGYYWGNPGCGHPQGCTPGVGRYVSAWNHNGNPLPGWPRPLGGYTWASPAIGDLDDDGEPEVIINSSDGFVHALKLNGSEMPGWPVKPLTPATCSSSVSYATNASPVVADLTGDGNREVMVVSNWEVVVWNRNGTQLTRTTGCPENGWNLSTNFSLNSTPAVTDLDRDGDVEVLIGGGSAGSGSPGTVFAWDLEGAVNEESLGWPVFRHDPFNLGYRVFGPVLSAYPQSLARLDKTGARSNVRLFMNLSNEGIGEISFTATASHNRVTVLPSEGAFSEDVQELVVNIDTTGLPTGSYGLGIVTITATDGSQALPGNPFQFPVNLVLADQVHQAYLPTGRR